MVVGKSSAVQGQSLKGVPSGSRLSTQKVQSSMAPMMSSGPHGYGASTASSKEPSAAAKEKQYQRSHKLQLNCASEGTEEVKLR